MQYESSRPVTIVNNKLSPAGHDLLCVAHSTIAIPGGILIGWLVWSLAGWDVWDGVFKGTVAGLLMVALVAFGQILPRLAYLRYVFVPLLWLVTRLVDPPRLYRQQPVEGRPPTRPVALQHQKVWEQAQRRRGYVAPVTLTGWQTPDTEPLGEDGDEDYDSDDEPEHVMVDVDMDDDMMEIVRRAKSGKKSTWSRATMMREGWKRVTWDAATDRLVARGVLLPDKSALVAGYGQILGE